MCDQRNEPWVDRIHFFYGDLHIFEVLRDEDAGHAYGHDGRSTEDHAECGEGDEGASHARGAPAPCARTLAKDRAEPTRPTQAAPRRDKSDKVDWEQQKGRDAMPDIQISIPQIRKETC